MRQGSPRGSAPSSAVSARRATETAEDLVESVEIGGGNDLKDFAEKYKQMAKEAKMKP